MITFIFFVPHALCACNILIYYIIILAQQRNARPLNINHTVRPRTVIILYGLQLHRCVFVVHIMLLSSLYTTTFAALSVVEKSFFFHQTCRQKRRYSFCSPSAVLTNHVRSHITLHPR